MDEQAKIDLLNQLTDYKKKAFEDGIPKMSAIWDIIGIINVVPNQDKVFFRKFAEDLKNELFNVGVSTPLFDIKQFAAANEILQVEFVPSEIVANPISSIVQIKGFKELFIEMIACLKNELNSMKGYFFFQLQSDPGLDYIPLILHDDKCFFYSIKKKLESGFEKCKCYSTDEFKAIVESGSLAPWNYAIVLLLSTKVNDQDLVHHIKSTLKLIIDPYSDFGFIDFKTLETPKNTDFIIHNDVSKFLDEIEYVSSKFLMNAELSNDEEKLIKELFKHSGAILEYKVLKGGKSGSKVLEIKPKMKFNNEITKRFVAKFGPLDGKDKILNEMKAYSEFIANYPSPSYHAAQYEKNASVEGMKYAYASNDAVENSYSYATIVDDSTNKYHSERKEIIEKLFASDPFELWLASKEKSDYTVDELYSKYIAPEIFFSAIKKVKGLSDIELENNDLVKYFKKIYEYKFTTYKKVCHGDLHSENFFRDDSGIYLIDFGFTGLLHSLVDHTALECSIKFKHIPFFVEVSILTEIEDQLTLEESFNPSFKVSSARQDILKYFDIINKIRVNSITLCANPSSRLEYLISLFIMTCRQIQYSDLNRLYALKSAEKIGERIIQLISG